MGIREAVINALSALQFQLATRRFGLFGPSVTYQPLPWAGIEEGSRAQGSRARLQAIQAYLSQARLTPSVTLDVGANAGFFSLSFAEAGATAYAVEGEWENIRLAIMAERQMTLSGEFVPVRQWCRPSNISYLPAADVTLCLSIWHHWVRHLGLDAATLMLRSLIERCHGAFFFDTGEGEMPAHYNLPFRGDDAREWLASYLESFQCGRVQCIGEFLAFKPQSDERSGSARRHLFVIDRQAVKT